MPDDEISVKLTALTGGFAADMKGAAETVEQAGAQMAGGLQRANEGTQTLLGTVVRGQEGRHLRLMALEIGSLGGVGTAASRGLYSLLGAGRALEEGLTTMTGIVGLTIAAVGLLVTGFVAWTEHTKKQREEQEKLNEATRLFHEASLGTVTTLREWLAAGRDLPAWLGQTKAGLDRAFSAQTVTRIEDVKEKIRYLDADTRAHAENTLKNAAAVNQLSIDMQFLVRTGMTMSEWMKKQIADEERLKEARRKRAEYYKKLDADERTTLHEMQHDHEAFLRSVEQGYDGFARGVTSSLMSAARAHKNFMTAVRQDLITFAEDRAVLTAVELLFGVLTGVAPTQGLAGILAGGGRAAGAASGENALAVLFGRTQARQGG